MTKRLNLSSESQFWFPCILSQNQIRWTVSCNLVLFPKILVWACSVESFIPIYLTCIWWHLFKNNTFRQLVLALMNTKFNRCNEIEFAIFTSLVKCEMKWVGERRFETFPLPPDVCSAVIWQELPYQWLQIRGFLKENISVSI